MATSQDRLRTSRAKARDLGSWRLRRQSADHVEQRQLVMTVRRVESGSHNMRHFRTLILSVLLALGGVSAASAATDWNAVGLALGKAGTEMPGGVYRVGLPRSDLHVQLGDIELKPTFALGSWVASAPVAASPRSLAALGL